MSSWLLALAGWDPEDDARKPRQVERKRKVNKRKAERTTDLPEGVTVNRLTKKPERYEQVKEEVHVWETIPVNVAATRSSSIINPEEEAFFRNTKNFLLEKARILKVYWASGMTAKEASRDFTERGYSYETVKKYWTVFNRFHSAPVSTDRGEEE